MMAENKGESVDMVHDSQYIQLKRDHCAVCGSTNLVQVMDLPKLPLTGLFSTQKPEEILPGFDQQLLICRECFHGQLAFPLIPEILYDESYSFRTSESATARKGTEFFVTNLMKYIDERKFHTILDFGCNDLHLLKQLKDRADLCIGVDPVWNGKEDQCDDLKIRVIGSVIEEVDFSTVTDKPIDLVVCRHTMEHIYDPVSVVQKLMSITSDDAMFVIEVPDFEALVRRFRFDQVFHQHLQYFSPASLNRLFKPLHIHYLGHCHNYHDWGALLAVFTKQKGMGPKSDPNTFLTGEVIRQQLALFQAQMVQTSQILTSFSGSTIYGYGAAQMLPILAYHMKNDLSILEAVLDDDPAKNGMYYQNLPLLIRTSAAIKDFDEVSFLITAFDNIAPILTKLLNRRPKHVILPIPLF
jgi:hypothetical protein